MTHPPFTIRPAVFEDQQALLSLHARSMRVFGAQHYDQEVIDAFIVRCVPLDRQLIADRTYFVAEAPGRHGATKLIGSGGFSFRRPSHAAANADGQACPTVRAVYVDPKFARQGIGRAIMAHIEGRMLAIGERHAVLASTLPGIPFYRRLGWTGQRPVMMGLPGGLDLMAMAMSKRLDAAALAA